MVSKHDKDAINEISTIRKNEERIQKLKHDKKVLKDTFYKILEHDIRITIYKELSVRKKLTAKELLKKVDCSKPTLYKHLKWLRNKGIIKRDKSERPVKFELI